MINDILFNLLTSTVFIDNSIFSTIISFIYPIYVKVGDFLKSVVVYDDITLLPILQGLGVFISFVLCAIEFSKINFVIFRTEEQYKDAFFAQLFCRLAERFFPNYFSLNATKFRFDYYILFFVCLTGILLSYTYYIRF